MNKSFKSSSKSKGNKKLDKDMIKRGNFTKTKISFIVVSAINSSSRKTLNYFSRWKEEKNALSAYSLKNRSRKRSTSKFLPTKNCYYSG